MVIILVAKIVTTSLTISSGGSGGVFGPTLFIGGMLGGIVGLGAETIFPGLLQNHTAFVLVGMSAFFAGVANAPIGALLMCCEMTGGYDLLVPLMVVSGIAILFSRKWSIYEKQVKDKFSSPAHIGEMTIDVLEEMPVREALRTDLDMQILPHDMNFRDFRKLISQTTNSIYPIKNHQEELIGMVSIAMTRPGIFEHGLDDLVILADIATPLVTVTADENLREALVKFLESNHTQLPVVDEKDPNHIIGHLRHEDLIHAYHQEILARKQMGEDV
jgi:CIC family chloride channel protein